ncbi:MAG: DNA repair protein RecO [Bacteroidota bacterium]|nr:DNA repair protein RecO [Bacteroidota bacterium]
MYSQTKGIVLSSVKYSESSIICKIYTAKLGLQSYIVNGVRKKKGGSAYYQPLNILDLTVYHKNNMQLQRIKEVKTPIAYSSIPFHVLKSSVALFLAEVLSKCLKEEEENQKLYCFLETSLVEFDKSDFDSQFHIRFLITLSSYLGFYPNMENTNLPYFDLINGCFSMYNNKHKHYITNTTDLVLALKLEPIQNKKIILKHILEYYQLHIDGFGRVKSVDILENILST